MNQLFDVKMAMTCYNGVRSVLLGLTAALVANAAPAQDDTSLPAIPDFYQEAGLSPTKGYENQGVNEAIDTFSGKLQYHFTDLFIPGNGGMDLAVQRSYNAIDDPLATTTPWPQEFSPAGLGWTMHFGRIIRGANIAICSNNWAVAGKNPVLEMPDGQRRVLYEYDQAVPTMWITKDFWKATCNTSSGVLGFDVVSPDGVRYEMTTPGHSFGPPGTTLKTYYTTRIVDSNGNIINLKYTTVNGVWAVSSITTSEDRSVSFRYNGTGLESITDGLRTWTYNMTTGAGGRNYLTSVVRPDGLSWKFDYRSSSPGTGSMSKVTYPSGGTIDYSYDHVYFRVGILNAQPSTVVKTKVANPGAGLTSPTGTWTYSYSPATERLPYRDNGDGTGDYFYTIPLGGIAPTGEAFSRNQLDITTVVGPETQTVEHYHVGLRSVSWNGQTGRGVGQYAGYLLPSEVLLNDFEEIRISSQNDVTQSLFGTTIGATYAFVGKSESRYRGSAANGGYHEAFTSEKSNFDVWGNPSTITEKGFGGRSGTYTRTISLNYNINTSKWLIRQISKKTVTVDEQNHTITRNYDNNGNMITETVAGVPTTFTYFATGDVQSRRDALNNTTSFSNYKRGIPQLESQPGGVQLSRIVDNAGNVTSATNGRGFTTTYSYDSLNRVTSVNPPVGNSISVDYTANTRRVTRGGMINLRTFDGLGRLVRQNVSATGVSPVSVDYRYDAKGRRIFQSYPNSSDGLSYTYDDLDRVVETAYPSMAGQSYSIFNRYVGLETRIYDSLGRGSAKTYRAFSDPDDLQLIESWHGRNISDTSFAVDYRLVLKRNVKGQVTSVLKGQSFGGTDGWERSYKYNENFHLISQTDPEIGTTTYGRDLLGNMTSKKIGSQPATIYGLDARSRVISITYGRSDISFDDVPDAPEVFFSYLNTDVVSSVSSAGSIPVMRRYGYDAVDKVISEKLEVGSGTSYRSFTIGYSYNGNDAMSSLTYPSGSVVSFDPDGFGRPRSAAPYVTGVDYHASGVPSLIRYANGVTSGMSINERLWPASLEVSRSSSSIIDNAYSYDVSGNLTQIDDNVDSTYNRSYRYDNLNRMTKEFNADGGFEYVYDNIGNMLGVNREVGSSRFGIKFFKYDGSSSLPTGTGRLSSVSFDGVNEYRYSYDSAGNVRGNGRGLNFGFDQANNMRCSNCGKDNQMTSLLPMIHWYDGNNVRVLSIEDGTLDIYSFYDHRGLLLRTESPRSGHKEYIYLGRRQVAERKLSSN